MHSKSNDTDRDQTRERACVLCKHSRANPLTRRWDCERSAEPVIDVVTGEEFAARIPCADVRDSESMCGAAGRWFDADPSGSKKMPIDWPNVGPYRRHDHATAWPSVDASTPAKEPTANVTTYTAWALGLGIIVIFLAAIIRQSCQ